MYATEKGRYLVQGWKTGQQEVVEIAHLLPGFAEPDTYIGATMTDTGRGTFWLSGIPVTDPDTLAQMTIADHETAIEVPKKRRTYYGGADTEQPVARPVSPS
ncbi:hypothetical protein [Nocardia sp. NPDC002869]|uniref:hypothetical protein n=1 Tax=Nocardia sp. NPDC002869 TaxID=3161032 RepID=UPI00398CF778